MSKTHAADTLQETRSMSGAAGKYLTFGLGREEYGLPVLKVREIITVSYTHLTLPTNREV